MNPRFLTLTVATGLAMLGTLPSKGQNQVDDSSARQEIYLLSEGLDSAQQILLTLNNNNPAQIAVDLTAYALDGSVYSLPSITLSAGQSRLARLDDLLMRRGISRPLGLVKVSYQGKLMAVGAQLTLYPVAGRGGLDSARSLAVDFIGNRRTATAWLDADSRATLAYSNVSESPLTVTSHLAGSVAQEFTLLPHETRIETVSSSDLQQPDGSAFSSDLVFTGAPAALRVAGYITRRSDEPLPIRYYDPATSTTQNLIAVGLDTSSRVHVSVYNTSSASYVVRPELRAATDTPSGPVSGQPVDVPAGKAVSINIDSLLKSLAETSALHATLTMVNTAPIGGIIGSVSEENGNVDAVEDIPLRTSNPQSYMRGAYPLRWTEDYANTPMVTNASDKPKEVLAYVIAGGVTYNLPSLILQPKATHIYNVDEIRSFGTKDFAGNVIPLSATSGKFHWTGLVREQEAGLIGRMKVVSKLQKRVSSFSCGTTCPGPDYWPVFNIDPFGSFAINSTTSINALHYYHDAYGNTSTQPVNNGAGLTSATSSILSMSSSTSSNIINEIAHQFGTSAMSYKYYYYSENQRLGGECAPNTPQISTFSGVGTVQQPDHVKILVDQQGIPASCPKTGVVIRQQLLQVEDPNNKDVAGAYSIAEQYLNLSANSCNNGAPIPSSCAPLNQGGQFLDTEGVTGTPCSTTIPQGSSCGYTHTSVWSMCSNGQSNALWNSPRATRANGITINGNASTFAAGTQLH